MESNDPRADDPTLGTIVGDAFCFIANAGWGLYDEEGRVSDPSKLSGALVLKAKL